MNDDGFTLDPLRKACRSLEEALDAADRAPADRLIRDAVIQRFEYTYELSWKTLKRYLETRHGQSDADLWSRRDLFRVGAEAGLIASPTDWFEFTKMRNLSSHTYNEHTADRVASVAPLFRAHCGALLAELSRRLERSPG